MAILKVARMGHPILRRTADPIAPEEIGTPEIQGLIADMFETMAEYDGVGLAAPQVHVSRQLLVMGSEEEEGGERYPSEIYPPRMVLINPEVTALTDEVGGMWEGCLSIPEIRGYVERPLHVEVTAFNEHGERVAFEAQGFAAIVIQHETDHLFGRLFVDRLADPTKLAFLREFERYHLGGEAAEED